MRDQSTVEVNKRASSYHLLKQQPDNGISFSFTLNITLKSYLMYKYMLIFYTFLLSYLFITCIPV